jgi:hypothetical protein
MWSVVSSILPFEWGFLPWMFYWISLHSINRNSNFPQIFGEERGCVLCTSALNRHKKTVLTFIKWRLTPSYAAKDTIFWQKRPKTIVIRIIVRDNKNSNLFIWPSIWTRLEHAHCLETINNMWFLGKRESVNTWKKVDFDGFREKDE